MQLLIAYDGTPSARAALELATSLRRDGDEVTVISVALLGRGGGPRSAGAIDPVENVDKHRAELEEAREMLAARGITARTVESLGEAGPSICAEAERSGHDMIFVGSRNLNPVGRLMLGSVSDYVVHHAHCAVCVAKHHDAEAGT